MLDISAELVKFQKDNAPLVVPEDFPRVLKKNIEGGDVQTMRMALFMESNDERNNTADLVKWFNWMAKNVDGFVVPYEESGYSRKIITDKSQWTTDTYHMQEVYARNNYAKERVLNYFKQREHLRQTGVLNAN